MGEITTILGEQMIKHGMSNENYHASEGLNSSTLKMLNDDPASIEWAKDCPIDEIKLKTLDFGSALHTSLLEPHLFLDQYAIEPKVNKRTNAGKEQLKDFMEEHGHKTILSFDESRKLDFMRDSVLSHPTMKMLIENKTGVEVSYFVEDPDTELILKCRNDLEAKVNDKTFVVDIKTIDKLDRISKNIYDFHYHLQESHYKRVYEIEHGKEPDAFLFCFISKTIELGRYPLKVVELSEEAREKGLALREDLITRYSIYKRNNKFPGVETVGLPRWAE